MSRRRQSTFVRRAALEHFLYLGIYELVRGKLNGAGGLCAANPRVKVLATVLSPSDQHEADLTNLILAWYHTGFFTAVYQERHGRR